MSCINGKPAEDWIRETHPHNGLFRVYWTKVDEVISFEDTGLPVRYEWYYKDGTRADGVSKGWWPTGQLKHTWTWKNGKKDGLHTYWFENGVKRREVIFANGKANGLSTFWYDNGQKKLEGTFKDGLGDGLYNGWYKNGQKSAKQTFKDGLLVGLCNTWYENGQKRYEKTYKVSYKSTTNVSVLTSSGMSTSEVLNGELVSEKWWDEDGNEKENS